MKLVKQNTYDDLFIYAWEHAWEHTWEQVRNKECCHKSEWYQVIEKIPATMVNQLPNAENIK